MSLQSQLSRIQDELDSIQVHVRLRKDGDYVVIETSDQADRLIAMSELRKAGIPPELVRAEAPCPV